jgi:hypothetical protein
MQQEAADELLPSEPLVPAAVAVILQSESYFVIGDGGEPRIGNCRAMSVAGEIRFVEEL